MSLIFMPYAMGMIFPSGSLPAGPPIQEGKALLLVDFQNDFVSPQGKLPVPAATAFLPQIPVLANKFRAKGTVIWCRTEYKQPREIYLPEFGTNGILLKADTHSIEAKATTSADYRPSRRQRHGSRGDPSHTASHDPEAILAKHPKGDDARPCMSGTYGAQYPELIAKAIDTANDIEVVKSHYSAFTDTPLLLSLRMRLITHLYVCGSLSNVSVYATVLDAVRHGIQITLIEDLLGFLTEACHIEAVRQMVDRMGAMGVDFQELMDDLAGLLGDVIHEADFASSFQVSIATGAPPGREGGRLRGWLSPKATDAHDRVQDWREEVWPHDSQLSPNAGECSGTPQKIKRESPSAADDSSRSYKSSRLSPLESTAEIMSPRRRGFADELEDADADDKAVMTSLPSPSVSRTKRAEIPQVRISKPRVRRAPKSQETTSESKRLVPPVENSEPTVIEDSEPTVNLVDKEATMVASVEDALDSSSNPNPSPVQGLGEQPVGFTAGGKKKSSPQSSAPLLGVGDNIGAGDSSLHLVLLDPDFADRCFTELRDKVRWQKMYHRSGEVPRLVAVQGEVNPDGDIPIYRHPADESPELLPFDEVVQKIGRAAEKVAGHPLNHVLIQRYRSGEDGISEHSDKSLDIVQGSKVVNVSFGARRTMTLRSKRVSNSSIINTLTNNASTPAAGTKRASQRIHLPHNSLFLLGPLTNQYWLHAIRPDKRPLQERDPEEVAFDGERISLTFRHIGTFVNPKEGTIWGQGATGKTREEMIIGFGRENHQSADWDWDQTYGQGWDVVNYETKTDRPPPPAAAVAAPGVAESPTPPR
ncbi:hypothetical protein DV735_g4162, partial [Chaetothyriales sp. CBS 134920]